MSLFTVKGNFQPTISLVCFPQPLTLPVWRKVMNYKRYKMMPRNFYWPQTGLLFHNCNCRLCLLEHKYIFKLKQLPWCLWWVLNGTLIFWSLLELGKLRALEGYSGEERRLLSKIFCKAMSPGEPWPWAMSWIPGLISFTFRGDSPARSHAIKGSCDVFKFGRTEPQSGQSVY